MDTLLALAVFLLSLFGWDVPRGSFEGREIPSSRHLLHVGAAVQAGVARVECLVSATGRCPWTVLPPPCGDDASPCGPGQPRTTALASDAPRELPGVSRAPVCISHGAKTVSPACRVPGKDAR